MDKNSVAEFFDSLAEKWDTDIVKSEEKIKKILDIAEIKEGVFVLYVGCGTGVLVPDYINRHIGKYTGIDISEKMIEISRKKFGDKENISFVCADAESYHFTDTFNSIVIYNAFPHFVNPELLFENLYNHLANNGRLTVAHGMSRESLIKHHSGIAKNVSSVLPEANELAKSMKQLFEVDTAISNDEIYIVSGKKRYNETVVNS